MCKSLPEQYPGLTYTEFEEGDRGDEAERATLMVQDIGFPFHAISAAELQSTTKVNSDLGIRMIKHIEDKSKQGYLKIPNAWIGFNGVIIGAKDAQPYSIRLAGEQFDRSHSLMSEQLSCIKDTEASFDNEHDQTPSSI